MPYKIKSCIYEIINTKTQDKYIGSTVNFISRKSRHFTNLENNQHENKHLQSAYNKYGKDNFRFNIILFCDKNNLLLYEQNILDAWKPEYNICKIAGNCLGVKRSKEVIEKKKLSRSGYKPSEETRRKISETKKGNHLSEKHKKALSISHINYIMPESQKQKISESNKGKHKDHLASFNVGFKANEQHYNHKLSNRQVIEIQTLFSSGTYKQKEIAKIYNVNQCTISRIINKKRRIQNVPV